MSSERGADHPPTRSSAGGRRSLFRAVVAALAVVGAACAMPPAAGSAPAENTAPADAALACPSDVPQDELVELAALEPTIRTEIRYATHDNFTGAPLPGYEVPKALLRREAAQSLARVQQRLRSHGLGLKVWDAYRPVRATLAMVEWAERTGNQWVLEQGYVARRSGHNLGNTVDLTLVRLATGEELPMGTAYDQFSAAAHTANARGPVAANRELLVRAMEEAGWRNYPKEWWHFSFPGDFEPLDIPTGCF